MKKVAENLVGQRSDLDIVQPGFHSPEALLHGDVIHHHHTICLAKELLGYAAVPVMTQHYLLTFELFNKYYYG